MIIFIAEIRLFCDRCKTRPDPVNTSYLFRSDFSRVLVKDCYVTLINFTAISSTPGFFPVSISFMAFKFLKEGKDVHLCYFQLDFGDHLLTFC